MQKYETFVQHLSHDPRLNFILFLNSLPLHYICLSTVSSDLDLWVSNLQRSSQFLKLHLFKLPGFELCALKEVIVALEWDLSCPVQMALNGLCAKTRTSAQSRCTPVTLDVGSTDRDTLWNPFENTQNLLECLCTFVFCLLGCNHQRAALYTFCIEAKVLRHKSVS